MIKILFITSSCSCNLSNSALRFFFFPFLTSSKPSSTSTSFFSSTTFSSFLSSFLFIFTFLISYLIGSDLINLCKFASLINSYARASTEISGIDNALKSFDCFAKLLTMNVLQNQKHTKQHVLFRWISYCKKILI